MKKHSYICFKMAPLRIAVDYSGLDLHAEYDSWMIVQDLLRISRLPYRFLNLSQILQEHSLKLIKGNRYDTCIDLLARNHIDLCPIHLSVTQERLKYVEYLTPYLYDNVHRAFILAGDKDVYGHADVFASTRIFKWDVMKGRGVTGSQ